MKIIQKNISEIKPDPNQPRKHFTDKIVDSMSVSIKNEGVINPIEIDANNIIITGEIRWRASKKADLKTIPCKVLEINDNKRFIRQMQENIHHNTMNAMDTADGFQKTLDILTSLAARLVRSKKHKGERYKKRVTELSNLYGPSKDTIRGYLELLEETKEVQKHIKSGKISHTKINEVNVAPEEYKKELKAKIIKQNYITRDSIRTIRAGLVRANMFSDKKAAKKIMSFDYKNKEGRPMTNREVVLEVNRIIPDTQTILEKDIDRVKQITQVAIDLGNLLKDNPLSSIREPMSKMSLNFQLKILILILDKYLKSQTFVKHLTDVNKSRVKLLKNK